MIDAICLAAKTYCVKHFITVILTYSRGPTLPWKAQNAPATNQCQLWTPAWCIRNDLVNVKREAQSWKMINFDCPTERKRRSSPWSASLSIHVDQNTVASISKCMTLAHCRGAILPRSACTRKKAEDLKGRSCYVTHWVSKKATSLMLLWHISLRFRAR